MPVAFHGKIWINSLLAGISEGFYLNVGSLEEAQARVKDYVSLRSAITPVDVNIVFASVSTLETTLLPSGRRAPDSLPVTAGFPVEGEWKGTEDNTAINIAADAIHVRFNSSFQNRAGNRLFRMIDDTTIRSERFLNMVSGQRFLRSEIVSAPEPPLFPNQYSAALGNVIKWLLVHTLHGYLATPGNVLSLTTVPWNQAVIIRPTQRNVGRPFGPFRGRRKASTAPA